jgi:hypothetical protein
MAQVDQLVKVGVMKPENKPSYDKIVDKSLYIEAANVSRVNSSRAQY